ncbi:site-specific integrase [Rhizobium grahamii]|uniref:Phage integrase n=1 Tax=Rhizobium grahamii CCGE 502 TaxID=990285 RepID=S3HAX8_9HYPH|nr:site-specific integrase [Rhizobium grahamii]EPE95749.1 phage integrase [Rhizobium grahamii CCGE 502]
MATIRKRQWTNKSGEHEAWLLNYMDANGKRHREQFDKKRDAEARRKEIEEQIGKGTYRPDAATTTVRAACEQYEKDLSARKDRGEKVTSEYFDNVTGHMWNYIAPDEERRANQKGKNKRRPDLFQSGIGDKKLSQLSARIVSEFRDEVRKSGVSVVTTRQILGTLSRVLQNAIANDLLAVNVAKGIRVVGKRNEDAKKIVPPSKDAIAAVIKAADDAFTVKLIFAAASGVRASEFHALRWQHLDLKAGTVTVETRVDSKRQEDTTKSKAGLREIPLGAHVIKVMKEWRLKTAFKKDDDLVFPNSKGKFENHKNMRTRVLAPTLKRAAEAMKEQGKSFSPFGWHALRHFAISTWIEAGLAPKTVQTFAGHSSLAVTMDRYGHLFPSDDHRHAMDAIASSIFANGA